MSPAENTKPAAPITPAQFFTFRTAIGIISLMTTTRSAPAAMDWIIAADADTQGSWACSGLFVGDSNEIDGDGRDDCACAESHQATDNYWALE